MTLSYGAGLGYAKLLNWSVEVLEKKLFVQLDKGAALAQLMYIV